MKDHFIPCLLLAGFCVGRSAGRKSLVWQFTSSGPHPDQPVPAADLARTDRFYEHEDFPDLDKAGLHDRETEAAPLIRSLVERRDPGGKGDEVARLVSVLAARTAAIRSQFASTARGLVAKFLDRIESAEGAAFLVRQARRELGDGSVEALERLGIPPQTRRRAQAVAPNEEFLNAIRTAIAHLGPELAQRILGRILDSGALEDAARKGQLKGLHNVVSPAHDRTDLRTAHWLCLLAEKAPFVLGDGCVIAVGAEGAVGWPAKFGKEWSEIYLPIHKDVCLVGLAGGSAGTPTLSSHAVNEASAGLARRYIYASQSTGYEAELARQIGTIDPMLEEGGLKSIVDDLFREDR